MRTLLWRMARVLGRPFKRLFTDPAVRYRFWFSLLKSLEPSPKERIVEMSMHFVSKGGVPGDYLEFGVFQGASFIRAFKIHRTCSKPRSSSARCSSTRSTRSRGCPRCPLPRILAVPQFQGGQYTCGRDAFVANLTRAGVDMSRVHLVEGFYEQSLNAETKRRLPLKAAAIVHIDCNLSESTMQVLEFLTEYIQDGTVLVFDDWFCFKGHPERGERRAFTEWLARHPLISATEWSRVGWQANAFILHRHESIPPRVS